MALKPYRPRLDVLHFPTEAPLSRDPHIHRDPFEDVLMVTKYFSRNLSPQIRGSVTMHAIHHQGYPVIMQVLGLPLSPE